MSPCQHPQTFLQRFLGCRPKPLHMWKVVKEETLSSHINFGSCPQEITTVYRIARHVKCVKCGTEDVVSVCSLHPIDTP